MPLRRPPSDELANCLTHGLGLMLSVAGLLALMAAAFRHGDAWHIGSCAVYGLSLVTVYASSTAYHAVHSARHKEILRTLDHVSIYLLIAGTYTPLALVTLRGNWGWTLFGLVWALALVGIGVKTRCRGWQASIRFNVVSTVTYVLLGWSALLVLGPLVERLPPGGLTWIFAGGVAYTVGVSFFACSRRVRYAHATWHLFVMVGSACHYLAIFRYVIPG